MMEADKRNFGIVSAFSYGRPFLGKFRATQTGPAGPSERHTGNVMRSPRTIVLLFAAASTLYPAAAQVNGGKPVLSATPPPPTANTPAQTTAPTSTAPIAPAGQAPPAATDVPSAGITIPPSADVSPSYVIGPDDTININVWKEPSLSGTLPVRPDGKISLPLVGDLQAAGYKPMDLAQDIAGRLKRFVNDPNVTVTVTGVNSKKIFLTGQVGHSGPMALTADMTPLQALVTGGVTDFAKTKKIYILRTVNGKQERILFDYKKALKTGDQQGVTLQSGDMIVVP